jgi:hypothetical protein
MPDKAYALLLELNAWRKEVGAQMPTINKNYDPSKIPDWTQNVK